jgi:hypothetical protein
MRYVWDRFDDYFGHHRGLVHYLIQKEAARLREWDRKTASRVDQWMANSHFVRDRILEFYGVDPDRVAVVHPPVEVEHFDVRRRPPVSREDRYLVVSALVPYKRIDHAVVACARSGRRLDVAGTGPEAQRLQELARAHGASDRIRFLGFVADDDPCVPLSRCGGLRYHAAGGHGSRSPGHREGRGRGTRYGSERGERLPLFRGRRRCPGESARWIRERRPDLRSGSDERVGGRIRTGKIHRQLPSDPRALAGLRRLALDLNTGERIQPTSFDLEGGAKAIERSESASEPD